MNRRSPFLLKGRELAPLVVGGMGVDISTSDLALAIAKLGGVGHISDAMVPFVSDKRYGSHFQQKKFKQFADLRHSPDKREVKWDPTDVYDAQILHVERTMSRKTDSGAVFINVMEKLTMGLPKETLSTRLRAAMDAGIDGITLSAGLHLGTLELLKDHPRFHDVMLGIIVSSSRALNIFLRSARKAARYPDYIVVEGPLAGGHLGFGMDWEEFKLADIVRDVIELLEKSDLHIPVIPAGGIFTGNEAKAFLEHGASAVQVATRFVVTKECGLPEPVKHKYLEAKEEDVVVNLTSPAGYPMRMLKSSPSLKSNVRPNCEALGYMLDAEGHCAYRDAYEATPVDGSGRKLAVESKMCICHHFMRHQCYTCGHNVFRLKDVVRVSDDGKILLPTAAEVFCDYVGTL